MTNESAQPPAEVAVEKTWEAHQTKTFTKWCNAKLKSTGIEIKDIGSEELGDGIVLAKLLSSISDETVKVNPNPTMRIHKLENVNKCLEFIKQKNVNLMNIGSNDIVDGSRKLQLGMIWTIILRFTIQELSVEGRTAREGLILWCQRRLAGYDNIRITDFTKSWSNGSAYAALVHSQDPTVYNMEDVSKLSSKERSALAFEKAEKNFSIASLLDPEDVCLESGPDEKSNMAYVAQFFHAFSEKANVERARRRINNFANAKKTVHDLSTDYENTARAYVDDADAVMNAWASVKFSGEFVQVQTLRSDFRGYRKEKKKAFVERKNRLTSQYSAIQSKAALYHFNPYVAPDGLLPEQICMKHNVMIEKEGEYLKTLNKKAEEIIELMLDAYSSSAKDFCEFLGTQRTALSSLSGPLAQQKSSAEELFEKLKNDAEAKLKSIEKLWQKCLEARLEDHNKASYSYDDLVFDYEQLSQELQKTINFMSDQISLSGMSNISEAQYKMYQSTFHLFDKDSDNVLSLVEFKAALAAVGIMVPDDQLQSSYKSLRKSEFEGVDLVQFISYIRRFEEDESSSSQMLEAFKIISGGKDHVTKEDFAKSGLTEEQIQMFTMHMDPHPTIPGAHDCNSYIKKSYSS